MYDLSGVCPGVLGGVGVGCDPMWLCFGVECDDDDGVDDEGGPPLLIGGLGFGWGWGEGGLGGGCVSATTSDGLKDVRSDKRRSSSASCSCEGLGGAGGRGSWRN